MDKMPDISLFHSEVELVGFTTCDGCPGGNIGYASEEMVKNGAEVINISTNFLS